MKERYKKVDMVLIALRGNTEVALTASKLILFLVKSYMRRMIPPSCL